MYFGNLTNCYTKSVIATLVKNPSFTDMVHFEMATSVMSGMVYHRKDVNRLIDCYCDPDIGIDRALKIFDIPFEICWWRDCDNINEILCVIKKWLKCSQIIIGPINMGALKYIPYHTILTGMDHYIVINCFENEMYHFFDPQGFANIWLSEEQLKKLIISSDVIEGRGKFTIRRFYSKIDCIYWSLDIAHNVLKSCSENLFLAQKMYNGGVNGYLQLADDFEKILNNPSLVRGLTFSLPTRMQRSILLMYLINDVADFNEKFEIKNLLEKQVMIFSDLLSLIKSSYKLPSVGMSLLQNIGTIEAEITKLLS